MLFSMRDLYFDANLGIAPPGLWRGLRWRAAAPFRAAFYFWQHRGLPDALIKAIHDPFDYALGLKNGQVMEFTEARLCRPFVFVSGIKRTTIKGLEAETAANARYPSCDFDRGVDIRISEIAWVADAPHGS